jgi:hypothetical protein
MQSQNGWPVLQDGDPNLYTWRIRTKSGLVTLRLRNGSAGFILAHLAMWFSDTIEPLFGKLLDDWGWAYRPVRGQTEGFSNHASGTAEDLNATQHPRGVDRTFSDAEITKIHKRLKFYRNVVRWGQDYQHSPKDGMHFEIVQSLHVVEGVARFLMITPRGRKLLKDNPTQKAIILS